MHDITAPAITGQRQPSVLAGRPVWLVSTAACVIALAVTELYGLIARLGGIPMAAAGWGQAKAQPVTADLIAMGIVLCAFCGTVLAVVIARFAPHPARTYAVTTVALTALSLAMPLSVADTATATRLTLVGAHLLAAAIVIPMVTRRLASRAPR